MSISVFPVPVAEAVANASSITVPEANTLVKDLINLKPAIYTLSCISSTVATIDFFNGNTFIVRAVTSSGTVDINLASAADNIRIFTNTGTNIIVTLTFKAAALTNDFSGTLDTITTTSTYTGTSTSGFGYVVAVGGGGGGQSISTNNLSAGGGSGAISAGVFALTGSISVTIGSGGSGGAIGSNGGTNGGTTTFETLSAGGGNGGVNNVRGLGGVATGGTFNITGGIGGGETFFLRNALPSLASPYPFIVSGTTGGGGGLLNNLDLGVGAGSGIGTGGSGKSDTAPDAVVGNGGGGGACCNSTNHPAGDGGPGVVFVVRY
jgi:hypothetical protein